MKQRGFVVVRLKGGLGNQMFQYAAGRSLSVRTSQPLFFVMGPADQPADRNDANGNQATAPAKQLEPGAGSLARLRIAPMPQVGPSLSIRMGLAPWPGRRGTRILRRVAAARGVEWRTDDPAFGTFRPEVVSGRGPAVLDGYFQTERYFADIAPRIREELQPREDLGQRFRDLVASIRRTPSVGVHVRRADYLRVAPQEDLPDDGFFQRGVAAVAERIGEQPTVFGFGDDPGWLAGRFKDLFPDGVPVSGHLTVGKYEDLFALAACEHQVISPSSFGWWGAWLNPNPHKTVVAPFRWFFEDYGAEDIVPPSWDRR